MVTRLREDGLPVGISPNMTEREAEMLTRMLKAEYKRIRDEINEIHRDEREHIARYMLASQFDAWSKLCFRLHYFHPILRRPCELEAEVEMEEGIGK